jgi:hypothetical protein
MKPSDKKKGYAIYRNNINTKSTVYATLTTHRRRRIREGAAAIIDVSAGGGGREEPISMKGT